jgi:hypothetical protein
MTWLSKPRIVGFILSLSAVPLCAAPPSAAQIFARYIRVTGGEKAWSSKYSERTEIEGRSIDSNGVVLRAAIARTRSGNALNEVEIPLRGSEGVYNGVAWVWTKLAGPRIKRDEDRDTAMRSARMLEEGDWRAYYPKSRVSGMETIEGRPCYRVSLLPSEDRRAEWFDAETGLLVRRASQEQMETVESWRETDGLKQPASWIVDRGDTTYRLNIVSVRYNDVRRQDALRYPASIEEYLAEERAGKALPNAEEIIERHIAESGGTPAFERLKTQKITGTLEFVTRNIEARTEAWSGGSGRYYQSIDIPGLGREEQGSDGRVSWERSAVLGPRARPRKSVSSLGLTVDAAGVIGWRYLVDEVRTEAQEKIEGHDCYRVRVTGRGESGAAIRWYDRQTGLLYRASVSLNTPMGQTPAVITYEQYRNVDGILWPVRLHMTISGQEIVFNAAEVALNDPIDESVFQLPREIQQISDGQALN